MKRVIATLVLLTACLSPGDAVGQVDALKPSTLDVDLATGDTLRFRVDTEVEMSQDMPRREAVGFLEKSQLVVTVKDPKGPTIVRCPLRGNGTMQGMSGRKVYEKGLVVSCAVPATQAGKHQVSATVDWTPDVKPLTATVEVRRVKK